MAAVSFGATLTPSHWPRPVFQVTSLEKSLSYYRDALGFAVDWLDQSGDVPACAQVSRDHELAQAGARVTRTPFKVRWDPNVHQMDVEDVDRNVLMFWGHVPAP